MDVNKAFLNGSLFEDVYMTQLEDFTSRSWNIRFDETIKDFGFSQNRDEAFVYKKVSGSAVVFLVLYVNDILLIGNNISVLESVKIWLPNNFSFIDIGETT